MDGLVDERMEGGKEEGGREGGTDVWIDRQMEGGM